MIDYPEHRGLLPACVFGNGMILQQDRPIPVWGLAEPGDRVTAVLEREGKLLGEASATTEADGVFYLELPTQKGSLEACSLTIADGAETVRYEEVLIGEVYLAAGQSNMELTNYYTKDGKRLSEEANQPYVRFCKVYREDDGFERVRNRNPQFSADTKWGRGDNGSDIEWASAVAYAFSCELFDRLGKTVPVGFVDTAQGGVRLETYLTPEQVARLPRLQHVLQEEKRGMELWGKHGGENYNEVTGLYNERFYPVSQLKFRGVLWYQGEGNVGTEERCAAYIESFEELCAGFSRCFGENGEAVPVLYALLAPYAYSESGLSPTALPEFWEAQHELFLRNPKSMREIPIHDLPLDYIPEDLLPQFSPEQFTPIHPVCKYPIGQRMADAALELVYGLGSPYIPPCPTACRVEGDALILTFSGSSGLKTVDGAPLQGFCICGAERKFVRARAELLGGQEVRLTADGVDKPVAATYAFYELCTDANLCDGNGVLAVPFRTDRVPSEYCC